MLPVSGRMPCAARSPHVRRVCRTTAHGVRGGARNAPARHGGASARPEDAARRRLLQHHEMLHEGLPRGYYHHRQRNHPAERARDRSTLRPGREAAPRIQALTEDAMMFQLKTLSAEAVPRALEKAERYRLLNEPTEAESICRDALHVDATNQQALAMLLLALTDQFTDNPRVFAEASSAAERLHDDYERAYYTGLIRERRAKAHLKHDGPV